MDMERKMIGGVAVAIVVTLCIIGSILSASAQQNRYYDSRGNSVGTSSTDSQGTTTFRNSRGSTVGRSYRN